MSKDPLIFIDHILESIALIRSYTDKLSKEEFLASLQVQDAVIRRIEIIGEAVRNLPAEWKQAHPEIPWQKIIGMRNVLIHVYFDVSLSLTWKTILEDLLPLEQSLMTLRAELEQDQTEW